jgi:hypothetical protein
LRAGPGPSTLGRVSSYEQERRNVGEGWWPLVDRLHADLTALVGEHDVTQIKQKYGGLRYYLTVPDDTAEDVRDEVSRLKEEAEEASYSICEACGAAATQEWIGETEWTVCARHRDELAEHASGGESGVLEHPPPRVGVVVATVLAAAVTLTVVLALRGPGSDGVTLPAVVGTALLLVIWAAIAARRGRP